MAAYEACRATFAALNDENASEARALRLDKEQPGCRCEAGSVSEHSSGRIEDAEVLVRILVAPQHIDKKTGLPRPAALTDAERNGLSLFRDSQATDAEIRTVAEGLVARARSRVGEKAGVFGVLRMRCSTIRGCRDQGEIDSCYCVYDTALEDIPSHAETFQRVEGVSEAVRDDRRRKLFSLVRMEFISVSEFRNGLLSHLAPGG